MTEQFAFVDESLRPGRYLLAAVVVEAGGLAHARRQVRQLLLRGQRVLDFQDEGDRRRRQILSALAGMQLEATVYICGHRVGRGAEPCRAACLADVVRQLQDGGRPAQMLIESRESADRLDRATIIAARSREPLLTFQHLPPRADPMLWVPDCVAWAVGAGPEWRRRVDAWVTVREVG